MRNARPLVFLLIKVNENEDYTNKPETVVPIDYSKLAELPIFFLLPVLYPVVEKMFLG